MKKQTIIMFCFSLIFLSSCATKQELQQQALALSIQHFKDTMVIKDDDFEFLVTFSTRKGYDQRKIPQGIAYEALGGVLSDSYLRGFISKSTGEKSIQCYVVYRHRGRHWAFPGWANYGRPLRTTAVTKIGNDVDCHNSKSRGCLYEEHVGFIIDQDEIDRIKSAPKEALNTMAWGFRLKNKNGKDYNGIILLKEFRAIIEVMENYSL